jgi:hypothetical protein
MDGKGDEMKEGDAVRIDTPGESAHGMIGHITRVAGKTGEVWVFFKEDNTEWKYRLNEVVAVQPEL